jgi:hypothetical protein
MHHYLCNYSTFDIGMFAYVDVKLTWGMFLQSVTDSSQLTVYV